MRLFAATSPTSSLSKAGDVLAPPGSAAVSATPPLLPGSPGPTDNRYTLSLINSAYLGNRTRQRRHVDTGTHNPPRPSQPRDDDPLRPASPHQPSKQPTTKPPAESRGSSISPPGRPPTPDRIEWLAAEMLKTRVAHGYCSRAPTAQACPRQHLRDLPDLRHSTRVRSRPPSPTRRHPPASRRRRRPRLGLRDRSTPTRHHHPRDSPAAA